MFGIVTLGSATNTEVRSPPGGRPLFFWLHRSCSPARIAVLDALDKPLPGLLKRDVRRLAEIDDRQAIGPIRPALHGAGILSNLLLRKFIECGKAIEESCVGHVDHPD